jgi:hypothetical protein
MLFTPATAPKATLIRRVFRADQVPASMASLGLEIGRRKEAVRLSECLGLGPFGSTEISSLPFFSGDESHGGDSPEWRLV